MRRLRAEDDGDRQRERQGERQGERKIVRDRETEREEDRERQRERQGERKKLFFYAFQPIIDYLIHVILINIT